RRIREHLHSFPTRRSSDLLRSAQERTAKNAQKLIAIEKRPARKSLLVKIRPPITSSSLSCSVEISPISFSPRAIKTSPAGTAGEDRKSTRLNSSHDQISYA